MALSARTFDGGSTRTRRLTENDGAPVGPGTVERSRPVATGGAETALMGDLTILADASAFCWSVHDATPVRHKTGTILH